jgi:hypothetical protein
MTHKKKYSVEAGCLELGIPLWEAKKEKPKLIFLVFSIEALVWNQIRIH